MGYVTDELSVLFFMFEFLIQRLFQPQPHIFIVPVQFPDFSFFIIGEPVFQIPLGNLLHGRIQLINRCKNAFLNPLCQHHTCKNENQYKRQHHINQHCLGNQGAHPRDNKKASFRTVSKNKIQLFYQLPHIVIIISCLRVGKISSVLRQLCKNSFCRLSVSGIIDFLIFSDNNIGRFIRKLFVYFLQIILFFYSGWFFLKLFPDGLQNIRRHLIIIFQRIGKGSIIIVKSAELLLRIHHINADTHESDC